VFFTLAITTLAITVEEGEETGKDSKEQVQGRTFGLFAGKESSQN